MAPEIVKQAELLAEGTIVFDAHRGCEVVLFVLKNCLCA